MSEKPETVMVKAPEVKPYHYGLWCSIEDGKPFVNTFVGAKWSDDGSKVLYMLDTHNFLSVAHDEMVEVVPLNPSKYCAEKYGNWNIGPRPGVGNCENCDLPRVSDEDAKKYAGGEGGEFCWARTAENCQNEPEDWRTRALKAEANAKRAYAAEAEALKALETEKDSFWKRFLEWREIGEADVCRVCRGNGRRSYPNTTTWHGGYGGQAFTMDTCDECWGSGSKRKPGPDLRRLDGMVRTALENQREACARAVEESKRTTVAKGYANVARAAPLVKWDAT